MRWPLLALAAAAALLLWTVWALYDTLFPVLLGFALAYAFDPLADRLERRGLSRTAAVSLIVTAVLLAGAAALALVIPPLLAEARGFALDFPGYAAAAHDRASALLEPYGVRLPHGKDELLARLKDWLEGLSLAALSPVGVLAGRLFSNAAGTLVGLLNLVVVPVVFFYFLRDISSIRRGTLALAPPRHRPAFAARLDEADRVFSGYLRGQLTVALILAAVYALGLWLVGIRFGVLIGIVSGLLNVIPYLGVALGLSASLIMAVVDFTGWGSVAGVLLVFALAQTAEGFFITPRIVGDKVGLSAVETIIALIVGGELGGLAGMLLAIPVAGCAKAWAGDAAAAWRRSDLYRG
jgi:predicted PurR-regulated permease PerM